ncbi:MAG: hypothetical protein COB08_017945 [Rhodobacteraceae bacterium]|nr:hypothetical protein [Paracoccaceae bacterium]
MNHILALIGLLFCFMSPVFADVDKADVAIETGEFWGLWRFAATREGATIGAYDCGQPFDTEDVNDNEIKWYRGPCNVSFIAEDLGLTRQVSFEIRAAHGIVPVVVSQAGLLSLANPTPTITISSNGGTSILTINSATLTLSANGYKGQCGFEYLYTQSGDRFESCGGQPTYLPLGTSWNLVIGGHQLYLVFIGHDGTPFPYSVNGHLSPLSRNGSGLISLTTIDVRLTPMVDTAWNLAGASPPGWENGMTRGAQTVRLPRFSQYRVGVFPFDATPSGANFTLRNSCDNTAQTLYIPEYEGIFMIQQQCETVRR